jgi:hypothetical protein
MGSEAFFKLNGHPPQNQLTAFSEAMRVVALAYS